MPVSHQWSVVIHPYTHPSIHRFIHPLVHPNIHSSIHPSTHPNIHSSAHPSIYPSSIPVIFVFPSVCRGPLRVWWWNLPTRRVNASWGGCSRWLVSSTRWHSHPSSGLTRRTTLLQLISRYRSSFRVFAFVQLFLYLICQLLNQSFFYSARFGNCYEELHTVRINGAIRLRTRHQRPLSDHCRGDPSRSSDPPMDF